MEISYILIIGLLIWISVLTFFIYKINNHYQKLSSWSKKESLSGVIETIIEKYNLLDSQQEDLKKQLTELGQVSKLHLTKIGLVRFNPFERVGGEQSHTLVVLTENKDGFLITSLYTRDGVRVYTKKLANGHCKEMELSAEEKEAIKKAS